MSTTAAHPRPGRRTITTGLVMMGVAAFAIAAAVTSWLVLGGPSSDDAVVFEMPGSATAELTAGDWGLYSQEVDGSQHVAQPSDITFTGPGDVTVESTYGFFSDDTSIDVDGTSYVVFARLDVPADGTYDVDIANASADTTVVLGHYTTDDTLGWVVVVAVLGGVLLGGAGFVTLVVGLVLRARGRRHRPA
ncbi:MAG: hypothetical protein H6529_14290 [Nocardioides sp.]|nr:hypothetical protein [Nocardioidaceae bacterium]MCB8957633.1 hypothetical protein [Nocardioides sp.]